MTSDDPLRRKYVEEMGHEPPVDESNEAWQWDYQGRKAEREELLERLGLIEDEPPQEETLFKEEE